LYNSKSSLVTKMRNGYLILSAKQVRESGLKVR